MIPRTIDICVSVIDNFGDIGFMTELLLAFEREYPQQYHFRIHTDAVDVCQNFLDRNQEYLPDYEIFLFQKERCAYELVIFLLFHFPVPETILAERHMVLRIDYLSFDPTWIVNNENEHIFSNTTCEIREIIPAVFPESSGLLYPYILPEITRKQILQQCHLPLFFEQKKWCSMFVYPSTEERIDFSSIPDTTLVFLLGSQKVYTHKNLIQFPFLTIPLYHMLLSLCDVNIVRGEVSAVAAMQIGKPLLWDMYKGRGGFDSLTSDRFLDFIKITPDYRKLHNEFNTGTKKLFLTQIFQILDKNLVPPTSVMQNSQKSLIVTLKKYIDRFYFSL